MAISSSSSSSSLRIGDSSNKENVPPCPVRSPGGGGGKKGRWRRHRRAPLADITKQVGPIAVLAPELPVAQQQLDCPSSTPNEGSQLLLRCHADKVATPATAAVLKRKSADAFTEKSNSLRKGFR